MGNQLSLHNEEIAVILRGIEFGNVFNAAGARGFFGEGYWFHRLWRPFGLCYDGATFIAKTTTLHPRAGNMRLGADGITPRRWKPDCIAVKFRAGVVLNAVGLSGPGAGVLLARKRWQERRRPFFLSFAAVGATAGEREQETRGFAALLRDCLGRFQAPVGLQVNVSCPNTGHDPNQLLVDAATTLDFLAPIGIPLVPKVNVLAPIGAVLQIGEHPACDAISVSNTLPWGALPERIPWRKLFGTDRSPLARYGGGGLSGKLLLPLVIQWIRVARQRGFEKPIMGGGGILTPSGALRVLDAGASAIEIGAVSILRPWRVRSIIREARRTPAERVAEGLLGLRE